MDGKQAACVQRAIEALQADPDLTHELEEAQLAAATGTEWYGITGEVFVDFLATRTLDPATTDLLTKAAKAIHWIYSH